MSRSNASRTKSGLPNVFNLPPDRRDKDVAGRPDLFTKYKPSSQRKRNARPGSKRFQGKSGSNANGSQQSQPRVGEAKKSGNLVNESARSLQQLNGGRVFNQRQAPQRRRPQENANTQRTVNFRGDTYSVFRTFEINGVRVLVSYTAAATAKAETFSNDKVSASARRTLSTITSPGQTITKTVVTYDKEGREVLHDYTLKKVRVTKASGRTCDASEMLYSFALRFFERYDIETLRFADDFANAQFARLTRCFRYALHVGRDDQVAIPEANLLNLGQISGLANYDDDDALVIEICKIFEVPVPDAVLMKQIRDRFQSFNYSGPYQISPPRRAKAVEVKPSPLLQDSGSINPVIKKEVTRPSAKAGPSGTTKPKILESSDEPVQEMKGPVEPLEKENTNEITRSQFDALVAFGVDRDDYVGCGVISQIEIDGVDRVMIMTAEHVLDSAESVYINLAQENELCLSIDDCSVLDVRDSKPHDIIFIVFEDLSIETVEALGIKPVPFNICDTTERTAAMSLCYTWDAGVCPKLSNIEPTSVTFNFDCDPNVLSRSWFGKSGAPVIVDGAACGVVATCGYKPLTGRKSFEYSGLVILTGQGWQTIQDFSVEKTCYRTTKNDGLQAKLWVPLLLCLAFQGSTQALHYYTGTTLDTFISTLEVMTEPQKTMTYLFSDEVKVAIVFTQDGTDPYTKWLFANNHPVAVFGFNFITPTEDTTEYVAPDWFAEVINEAYVWDESFGVYNRIYTDMHARKWPKTKMQDFATAVGQLMSGAVDLPLYPVVCVPKTTSGVTFNSVVGLSPEPFIHNYGCVPAVPCKAAIESYMTSSCGPRNIDGTKYINDFPFVSFTGKPFDRKRFWYNGPKPGIAIDTIETIEGQDRINDLLNGIVPSLRLKLTHNSRPMYYYDSIATDPLAWLKNRTISSYSTLDRSIWRKPMIPLQKSWLTYPRALVMPDDPTLALKKLYLRNYQMSSDDSASICTFPVDWGKSHYIVSGALCGSEVKITRVPYFPLYVAKIRPATSHGSYYYDINRQIVRFVSCNPETLERFNASAPNNVSEYTRCSQIEINSWIVPKVTNPLYVQLVKFVAAESIYPREQVIPKYNIYFEKAPSTPVAECTSISSIFASELISCFLITNDSSLVLKHFGDRIYLVDHGTKAFHSLGLVSDEISVYQGETLKPENRTSKHCFPIQKLMHHGPAPKDASSTITYAKFGNTVYKLPAGHVTNTTATPGDWAPQSDAPSDPANDGSRDLPDLPTLSVSDGFGFKAVLHCQNPPELHVGFSEDGQSLRLRSPGNMIRVRRSVTKQEGTVPFVQEFGYVNLKLSELCMEPSDDQCKLFATVGSDSRPRVVKLTWNDCPISNSADQISYHLGDMSRTMCRHPVLAYVIVGLTSAVLFIVLSMVIYTCCGACLAKCCWKICCRCRRTKSKRDLSEEEVSLLEIERPAQSSSEQETQLSFRSGNAGGRKTAAVRRSALALSILSVILNGADAFDISSEKVTLDGNKLLYSSVITSTSAVTNGYTFTYDIHPKLGNLVSDPKRLTVTVHDILCTYQNNVRYWTSDVHSMYEEKYKCCGTADGISDNYRLMSTDQHAMLYSHTFDGVFPCAWNWGACFCCGSDNQAKTFMLFWPNNDWHPRNYAVCYNSHPVHSMAKLEVCLDHVCKQVNVSRLNPSVTALEGIEIRVSSLIDIKCDYQGDYVLFDGNIYSISYSPYAGAKPGELGDVASRTTTYTLAPSDFYAAELKEELFPDAANGFRIKETEPGFVVFRKSVDQNVIRPISLSYDGHTTVTDVDKLQFTVEQHDLTAGSLTVQLTAKDVVFEAIHLYPIITNVTFSTRHIGCYNCDSPQELNVSFTSDIFANVYFSCFPAICVEQVFYAHKGHNIGSVRLLPSARNTHVCFSFAGPNSTFCTHVTAEPPKSRILPDVHVVIDGNGTSSGSSGFWGHFWGIFGSIAAIIGGILLTALIIYIIYKCCFASTRALTSLAVLAFQTKKTKKFRQDLTPWRKYG
ncbi:structural polyprotein [Botrylloides leachii nidovirus]|uniref:Structural polyprotein n=1 Tax=Botrylloides leachii nidovirus TaxID=2509395 RepID=A0A650BL23_9NIDO|nr:structural polyprotein [Botrylloides leachii nidovirus]QGQ56580.1 structural polyprotein [Botrylloides leachii nidovirus]